MSLVDTISNHKIIAVIRHAEEATILPILSALNEGGVKAVEITAETPQVAKLIEIAALEFKGEMLIGAGTVLDPETARTVLLAGAQFIVSPTVNPETIKLTNRYGILNISGALTPTEILTAYESGTDMVKVFPADVFGPGYIKNLQGPLGHIPVVVTGGVTIDNMNDFIRNGSKAVGIGSNLVNPARLKTEANYEELKNIAAAYRKKVNELSL